MGINSVIGTSLDTYIDALISGKSGITHWVQPMDPRVISRIGGDMTAYDFSAHIDRRQYPQDIARRMRSLLRATPLAARLACVSATEAAFNAGFPDIGIPSERFGHVLAGHNMAASYIAENVATFAEEPEYIEPLFGLMCLDTDPLSVTSELLGLRGPSFTVGGACASGNLAMMQALDLLRAGRADAVMVTGAPIDLDPITLHAWGMLDALAYKSFNDRPTEASRPFDARREGFVPSQSGGALLFETLESAQARGAHIHAEILGAGASSDASRLTRPDLGGQVRAMESALRDARVNVEDIDYVNAHATSTPIGDVVEANALKAVLGDRVRKIPVNSTKSMIGHSLTAASIVEMIATILQMSRSVVHPTINQEEKDPAIDLDVVPNVARDHKINVAMSNSFGFGGVNSCVVVGRPA
jgi:3-oxoacyl-(acyl-carrier-protein) synthase